MMAVSTQAQLYCSVCNMEFPFKSKLQRHLASEDHRTFANSISRIEHDGEILCGAEMVNELSEEVDSLSTGLNHCDNTEEPTDDPFDWDDSDLDIHSLVNEVEVEDDYSPFPNKLSALLYCLVNSPKPIGESNLKFIWFIFVQNCKAVPSISEIKKLTLSGLSPPQESHLTPEGVPFYMNSLSSIIQRCLGDTHISKVVQRFPMIPIGPYREMFHASRWHENSRFNSPMTILKNGIHVFTRDCITCQHSVLGDVAALIVRFFTKEGNEELFAEVDILLSLEQYQQMVPDTLAAHLDYGTRIYFETISITVSQITGLRQVPHCLLKRVSSTNTLCQVSQKDCIEYFKPNHLREKAAGRPVVMLPLVLFSDDTSGNKSKKWHKFDSWSLMLAGLSREENAKINNIHFICCSDVVSALDMAQPIAEQLCELETNGIEIFDALLNQPVLVVSPLICLLADNPRASEILNHLGSTAKKFCRMCMVDKDINPTTISEPRNLISSRMQIQEINLEPLQRKKRLLRTKYGLKEGRNPMLSLPCDLYQSTPVESLHTILLGPYKYLLKATIPMLSLNEKEEILARIRSFNYSGFKVRLIGNVVHHHKSFVGRDYKAWAQMALSIIYPYLSDSDKILWIALAKVFKITYCNYYDPSKKDEWLEICKNFVATVSRFRPDMLKKLKIHLILHLVDCMEQFGPTSAFNSERCETFNSFIRAQNIYGNKSAPSHDICKHFATIEQLRYVCGGGYDSLTGQRCGKGLIKLYNSPLVQNFMNLVPMKQSLQEKNIYQPGVLRMHNQNSSCHFHDIQLDLPDAPVISMAELVCQHPFSVHHHNIKMEDEVEVYKGVIGKDQKLIRVGDFVKLSIDHNEMKYGKFLLGLKVNDGRQFCMIRGLKSILSSSGDPAMNELHCPLMTLSSTIFLVKSSSIVFAVSVIHECSESCKFSQKLCQKNIEREHIFLSTPSAVAASRIEYEHDFQNPFYYLNLYCMNS